MHDPAAATAVKPRADLPGLPPPADRPDPAGTTESGDAALLAVLRDATAGHPGVTWASVSALSQGRFHTMACTDQRAAQLDRVQHRAGAGPVIEAALNDAPTHSGTFQETPWPKLDRAANAMGVTSFWCHRLALLAGIDGICVMTLYLQQPSTYADPQQVPPHLTLRAELLVSALLAQQRAVNLEEALRSNRDIGIAMGILMLQRRLTREQAFDELRKASNDTNRKLADVATTGLLEYRQDHRS